MDKWHNQFDKLKRQWSEFNRINSDYRLHDKRQIAKVGVAWVIKLPGEYFNKPVGWEVEIIDTPLGISERSNKLLKWLRNPPTNVYDNISLFNNSSDIMLVDSFENQEDTDYRRKYKHSFSFNEPPQRFKVPPNEYEVFKKTCCECIEKSFKNTSTDYESDIKASRFKQVNIPYSLNTKTSYFNLPPENKKILRTNQQFNSLPNHSLYSDFEKELNNQILDELTHSSLDRGTNHSKASTTSGNHLRHISKTQASNLPNQSIETSKVLSNTSPHEESLLRSDHSPSNGNKRLNRRYSPIRYHQNNHGIVKGETINKTVVTPTPHRRTTGSHIPSFDAFDDSIFTRGTSLEQYRDTDHIFNPSREEGSENKRHRSNGHRNHRRHRHRTSGSKDVSMNTSINKSVLPEYVSSEVIQEFDEEEESVL